ncbi:MAG: hypothetical protein WC451_01915 [Patescibacteria group bacterium]
MRSEGQIKRELANGFDVRISIAQHDGTTQPLLNLLADAGFDRPDTEAVCASTPGRVVLGSPDVVATIENYERVWQILEQIHNRPHEVQGKRLKITRQDGTVIDVQINKANGDDMRMELDALITDTSEHFRVFLSHFFIGNPTVELLD